MQNFGGGDQTPPTDNRKLKKPETVSDPHCHTHREKPEAQTEREGLRDGRSSQTLGWALELFKGTRPKPKERVLTLVTLVINIHLSDIENEISYEIYIIPGYLTIRPHHISRKTDRQIVKIKYLTRYFT